MLPKLLTKEILLEEIWQKLKDGFYRIAGNHVHIDEHEIVKNNPEWGKCQDQIKRMQIISDIVLNSDTVDPEQTIVTLSNLIQTEANQQNKEIFKQIAKLIADQAKKTGEPQEKLESLRASIYLWSQKQQKELQGQLKELEFDLISQQRLQEKQKGIETIKEQKKEKKTPLMFVAEEVINNKVDIRLVVLFSLRKIGEASKAFPDLQEMLVSNLRQFWEKYTNEDRLIEFLPGGWTNNYFFGEGAARAIYSGLKSQATVIIENIVEGDKFYINLGFWGINGSNYRYQKALSFSWSDLLFNLVKIYTLELAEKHNKAKESDESLAEFYQKYGQEIVTWIEHNLKIIEVEAKCIEHGYEQTRIKRLYQIQPRNYEELGEFIATCNCIFAGLLADEYFLLYVLRKARKYPLLPKLLPDLIINMPLQQREKLIKIVISAYETIYGILAKDESAWIPEFNLDLAKTFLPISQEEAKKQVNNSIVNWLTLHGVKPSENNLLEILAALITIEDRDYILNLNQCLSALGDKRQLNVVLSCTNRGINRLKNANYQGAIADFSQVIILDPKIDKIYLYRGLAYTKLEQYDLALKDYSQALKVNPQFAQVYYEIAKVYENLGQKEQAIAHYKKALALQPEFPEAKASLEKLNLKLSPQIEKVEPVNKEKSDEFIIVTLDAQGKQERRSQKQGEFFFEDLKPNIKLSMILIPDGSFLRGSTETEKERQNNESPQHLVTIKSFYLSKYPVTQSQWREVASLDKQKIDLDPDPSYFKGDNLPVEQISWEEAVEFCLRLSKLTGKKYRLPTEAEWEYACRAGTTTPFHFGETISAAVANYNGDYTYNLEPKGVYRREPTEVGSFGVANGFGLYDMHGLVWEWCADSWHDSYKGAPANQSVWFDDNNNYRIVRGGSWFSNPSYCRSAYRYRYLKNHSDLILGFRVAVSS